MEYATPVWSPHLQKDIEEIESVQRKFTKCIAGYRNYPYAQRLCALQLPTLALRREYYDLLECYKLIRGLVQSECCSSFVVSNNCTRGHAYKLKLTQQTPRLSIRANFLTERVVRSWNALPAHIVALADYSHFKLALKRYLKV